MTPLPSLYPELEESIPEDLREEMKEFNFSEEEARKLATRTYRSFPQWVAIKDSICFNNHIGDGTYPVFAKLDKNGQIKELKVSFDV